MDYQPRAIEVKWQQYWEKANTYKVENQSDKPKFYVLDMFPYPSGAGLHVGHPLGFIASDIFARYKRLKGFNILHPMGYDAFGLPAEQYAIQTGVHPALSTDTNIKMYRKQLGNLGFSFDWSREVKTSDPNYYKWTQWIFLQLFEHYFDNDSNKAQPIADLVAVFEREGNAKLDAATSQTDHFTAAEWKAMSRKEQSEVVMNYRLAYRKVTYVNWCEALGTVLANDEIKDGLSERGGHPVENRLMLQWSLRITAYAERLLNDLDILEWSDSLKTMQRNWIGRSEGAQLFFDIVGMDEKIEIFTTRADTVFGATFMVLAPEHPLVNKLTTDAQQESISQYRGYVNTRSERDRMAEVKVVTGAFTGSYANNPFTNQAIPIWIGEYVLMDYGTGAIMAVPSDDERDQAFAKKFGLEIIDVVDKSKYPGATLSDKVGMIINSDFLNGMEVMDAIKEMNTRIQAKGIGKKLINYKLRDANYSRQRYWGEPFPILYDAEGIAHPMELKDLPLELPHVDDFKPASGGKSPLAVNENWVNEVPGFTRETDTMPGFAGSSWYFLRYMDAHNDEAFAAPEAINYWRDVDLYVGGTEHAVGHLMYSRFWHKFLYDKGLVPTKEPFRKLINQGMIQGVIPKLQSTFFKRKGNTSDRGDDQVWVNYDVKEEDKFDHPEHGEGVFFFPTDENGNKTRSYPYDIPLHYADLKTKDGVSEYRLYEYRIKESKSKRDADSLHLNNIFDSSQKQGALKEFDWRKDEEGKRYLTLGYEYGKMSKSKYNVVNPDDIVERYGSDCFRMYEMFLGPVEQSKPWDTKGIDGVSKFLRKFWSLFHDKDNNFSVSDGEPSKEELKVLHTAIKKIGEDIERFSFNTCVSAFMIATNDLIKLNCNNRIILTNLTKLIAPFAPHIAEELWLLLGHQASIHSTDYPVFDSLYLVEDAVEYPISINGKLRTKATFPTTASVAELEKLAMDLELVQKWTEGQTVRKIIVVPQRMINIVVG